MNMISCNESQRMKRIISIVMILWSSQMPYVDGSCASKGDVVFLLDESGSIGSSNFERIKSFVSTVIGQFSVGNDTNQFSVVNFASNAREIFPLNKYQTLSSIQSAISNIVFSSGGTSIGNALNYARMYSFTTTKGARPDAAKIAVLITDGQSTLSDQPENLKAMGVTIFCVGVGTGVNSAVLRSVATHNDYTYLTTFDLLTLIADELSNRTCADDINDCLGEPCLNGGTCEDQFGKYVCHCQGGNTDPNCYVPGLPNITLGSNVLVYSGSTAMLNCYVTSSTTVSSIIWQYQRNGITSLINTGDTTKYSGGSVGTPSLSVKNVQLVDVGNYRCQAQNTAGIGQSESMIYLDLRQGYPNLVTTASYAVNASSNVTLTCNFSSSYPPVQMMQWYKYDSDITTDLTGKYIGGTLHNPSLTITDFQLDDKGIYHCSASNSYGTRNSSDIMVYIAGDAPAVLTGQNMTGSPGTTLTISCTILGGSISRVFWTFQPSDQDNETEIIYSSKYYWSSYSPSLRIYNLNSSDIGFYRCCVNSSNGLGRSEAVYATLKGKQINIDRSSYSVYKGDDVILSVSLFSMPEATNVTWMYSTSNYYYYYYYTALDLTSDKYAGGTVSSPSLIIRNVTSSDGGYYLMRLTNVDGTISSSTISLNVQKDTPSIYLSRTSYTVYTGSNVTFEANVTSKLGLTDLFWEIRNTTTNSFNPIDMSDTRIQDGDISFPSLTILDIKVSDRTYYRMRATNPDGTVISSLIYLNVYPNTPSIYLSRTYYAVYTGSNVTFEANVTSKLGLTDLFWEVRNTTTYSFNPIDMSDTRIQDGNMSFPSLTILDIKVSDRTYYRMQATNPDGTKISFWIYLYVYPNTPSIYLSRTYYAVYKGNNVTFEANVTSKLGLTDLFWEVRNTTTNFFNPIDMSDTRIQDGNMSFPSLTILDIEFSDRTYYRMRATNPDGTKISSSIYLYVYTNTPSIYLSRTYYTVYTGSNVTFEANVTSKLGLTDLFWEIRNTTTYSFKPIDMSDTRIQDGDMSFPSLTILDIEVSDRTYYRMRATNPYSTVTSSLIYLYVYPNLASVDVAASTYTVSSGENVTLYVTITNSESNSTITWERQGEKETGFNVINTHNNVKYEGGSLLSPSLSIYNITETDRGNYRCKVTNLDGTTTSALIYIGLNSSSDDLASVDVAASTYTVSSGENVTLYVTITNSESNSTITWERQGEKETGFNVINTHNNVKYEGGSLLSPSLSIYNITETDRGNYRCKVTNLDGTTTSALIYIGLNSSSDDLASVDVAASTYTVSSGENVTLYVTITNSESNSTITWERQGENETGFNVINTHNNVKYEGGSLLSPSLSIYNITETDRGNYRCKVTNLDGTTTSALIYIGLSSSSDGPPVVLVGGTSLNVAMRSSLSLQVNYTSGPDMVSVSWEKANRFDFFLYDSVNVTANSRLTGGTIDSPSLEINDVKQDDSGYYRCLVTNKEGTTISPVFTVNVQTIDLASVDVAASTYTVSSGENVTLYVTITNSESNSTITWERQGENETGFNVINTHNNVKYEGGSLLSPSLSIYNITETDRGNYRCKVTNLNGTTTSALIYIGLSSSSDDLASVDVAASTYTVSSGENVTLYVTITNSESNSTITWERQGENETGFNVINTHNNVKYEGGSLLSPSLSIYNITETDRGNYRCKVTNLDGTTTSALIYIGLSSFSDGPPVVSVGETALTVTMRSSLSLQVNYTSGPDMVSVSWEKGNTFHFFLYGLVNVTTNSRLTGGTIDRPSLEINDLKQDDSGYYRCIVTNKEGTTVTPVFTVNVQTNLASVDVAASTYTVSSGENVTLYVTITNSESNSTITWERQGENETGFNVINTHNNVKYEGGSLLSPSLSIYNITETDRGNYRCKVTNLDGTTTSALIYIGLSSSSDDSSCDKLSCGGLRECVLKNNKPTCSVSTWKAAAVAVASTVGAAASVAAGVAALKSLTSTAVQPMNGHGNSQGSNSNSNNRNNNDNNDHNSDNNSDSNSDDSNDDSSDVDSHDDDDIPDPNYIGGFQGVITSMPPPNM